MSDFEFPVDNKKTKKPAAKIQEEVAIEETSTKTVSEDKTDTPAKKQYDQDELTRIFDEILFTGEYAEDVTIKGKLRIRLKTRNAEELSQISKVIDGTSFTLMQSLNETRLLLNLQYALQSYQGKDLSGFKTDERAAFIRKLAGPLIGMLVDAMISFDEKVGAACRDLEENF
ncbi:hypothetical protein D3C87_459970 [compost metagenome]